MSFSIQEIRRKQKKLTKYLTLQSNLKAHTPILVYQMGKVGSSSIYRSLEKHYQGMVAQVHFFGEKSKNWDHVALLKHFQDGGKMKVISTIREPVGRNVSAFFQNFQRTTGVAVADAKFSNEELRKIFLDKYLHDIPLTWFDRNIKENFDIDVYAKPFPDKGYELFENKAVELLVMKLHLTDEQKEKVIGDFVGLENFKLHEENIGSQKDYAAMYKDFRKDLTLPDEYLEKFCSSKYFNHFFSQQEIEKVRNKYSKKG